MQREQIQAYMQQIAAELGEHIIGQEQLIDEVLLCLFAGGNLLLEGVPGLGKTKLVSTLAQVLDLDFKRIQFTPDLMPADITGTNIYNKEKNSFEFQAGPIFANLLLADEINRATPKTQAAMLEAMQEKAVTVAGNSYPLAKPYLVLATQNPIEQEGTYPLPEAQLDRFMFKLNVAFPSADSLAKIVMSTTDGSEQKVNKLTNAEELLAVIDLIKELPIAEAVLDSAMQLVLATHPQHSSNSMVQKYVLQGSSLRGGQALVSSAKVRALYQGRYNVAFADIKAVAEPALRHRMILNYKAVQDGISSEDIISSIIAQVITNG